NVVVLRAAPAPWAAVMPIPRPRWLSTWRLSSPPDDLVGNSPMSDSPERVLLIVHSDWREGRLAPLLQEKGYEVEWCCPAKGGSLPADDARYAGAVVLGGVQSANDAEKESYLRDEIDWIARRIAAGRPFLGICLGAQLMARSLGSKVAQHAEG